jgi:hypothetical protein
MALVEVSVQIPSQFARLPPQPQTPFEQVWPGPHAVPQSPQWVALRLVSTHVSPQSRFPGPHDIVAPSSSPTSPPVGASLPGGAPS